MSGAWNHALIVSLTTSWPLADVLRAWWEHPGLPSDTRHLAAMRESEIVITHIYQWSSDLDPRRTSWWNVSYLGRDSD